MANFHRVEGAQYSRGLSLRERVDALFSAIGGFFSKLVRAVKPVLLLTVAIAAITIIFLLVKGITDYTNKHVITFRSPFQNPVVIVDRETDLRERIQLEMERLGEIKGKPTATPTEAPPAYRFINLNLIPKAYANGDEVEMSTINKYKHAGIMWRIYMLESTFGKNDGCKAKGLFNGFGYGQDGTNHRCYTSFDAVAHDVNEWIETNLQKYTLAQAMCRYNTGKPIDGCTYFTKFMSIDNFELAKK